jgi:hypothetical protein
MIEKSRVKMYDINLSIPLSDANTCSFMQKYLPGIEPVPADEHNHESSFDRSGGTQPLSWSLKIIACGCWDMPTTIF